MPLTTVTVTIAAHLVVGSALPNGRVRFELTAPDVDGGIVVPQAASVSLDVNGEGSIELWPNSLGTQGTQYRVTVKSRNGGDLLYSGLATVPETNCNLHEIMSLAPPAVVDDAEAAATAAQASAAAAGVSATTTSTDAASATASASAAASSATSASGSATAAAASAVAADASADLAAIDRANAEAAASSAASVTGLPKTYYVDSVSGLDANNGLSSAAPFLTITKLLTVLVTGDTVLLARGSRWREALDLGAREGVTIDVYGGGALPIIDGADVIVESWTLVSGNVYRVDVVIPESGSANRCYPGVFEDGELLYEYDKTLDSLSVEANAIAAVQDREGSFLLWSGGSYASGWSAGATLRYYVHPTGSGDPSSNGKVYEHRKRRFTLRTNRSKISNLVCRRQFHHDGVCLSDYADLDGASSYYRVCFDQMPRHSVIEPSGVFEHCVAMRKNTRYKGYGFHAYKAVLGRFSPRYKNCVAIDVGSGWGTHSSTLGVSSHELLVLEDCTAIRCTTGFGGYEFDVADYIRCKTIDCESDVTSSQGANVSTNFYDCEFVGATYRPFAAPAAGRTATLRRCKATCQTADGYFFIQADVACGTLEVLDGSEIVWHRSYVNVSSPALITSLYTDRGWEAIRLQDSMFFCFPSVGFFAKTSGTGVVTTWDVDNCVFGGFLDSNSTNRYEQAVRGSIAGVTVADLLAATGWSNNRRIDPGKIYSGKPLLDGFGKRPLAMLPHQERFNAIAYSATGNTQPRAVMRVGTKTVMAQYAPDGFHRIIDEPASEMFGIALDVAAGSFVAVGASGLMRRSTSFGTVWSTVGIGATAQTLRGVSGKGSTGIMVAIGDSNTVLRSADGGLTWAAAATPPATAGTNWKAIDCDGTTFVIVGPAGKTARSTDGDTWTETTTGTTNFRAIAASTVAGTFVAVGESPGSSSDGEIKSTTDSGATWTARTSNCQSDLIGIDFGGGRWVSVADTNTSMQGPEVITSTDFITWTPLQLELPFVPCGICYAGYLHIRWVIGGQGNVIGQSTDGVMWKFMEGLEDDITSLAASRSDIASHVRALL